MEEVISFLNRDNHDKFRYLTLGIGGSKFDLISTYTTASSVDGDYNSARLLPEMTAFGAGQMTNCQVLRIQAAWNHSAPCSSTLITMD